MIYVPPIFCKPFSFKDGSVIDGKGRKFLDVKGYAVLITPLPFGEGFTSKEATETLTKTGKSIADILNAQQ